MGAVLARHLAARTDLAAFVSPQLRATQTADLALAPLGLVARRDYRLSVIMFGAWQGLTDCEIATRWPESGPIRRTDPFGWHFTAPGGESFAALTARLTAFIGDLDGPAMIVSHGIALRVLRGLCLGLDQAGMAALPGGQGGVWRIQDGRHSILA